MTTPPSSPEQLVKALSGLSALHAEINENEHFEDEDREVVLQCLQTHVARLATYTGLQNLIHHRQAVLDKYIDPYDLNTHFPELIHYFIKRAQEQEQCLQEAQKFPAPLNAELVQEVVE
jgi:3-methyladenine DNA glycosylase AlkD